MKMRNGVLIMVASLCVGIGIGMWAVQRTQPPQPGNGSNVASTEQNTTKKPPEKTGKETIKVMGIGGSAAYGWVDTKGAGGYLARAFRSLSSAQVSYQYFNKCVEGDGPVQYAPKFSSTLSLVQPQVLVISWGILDDLSKKTPRFQFQQEVTSEINEALAKNAQVMVVTPPVTPAAYTGKTSQEIPLYIASEIDAAKSFHSNRVYIYDIYNQMKQYLAEHHQTVSPYANDGWHPNAAGHILAGQILANDIRQSFKVNP